MNRRSRLRFKTDITVTVTSLDQSGTTLKGRLKNLSAHGLSVILKDELPADSFARVEWGSNSFNGRLVYCDRQQDEYLAGFEIAGNIYDARQKSKTDDADAFDPK